MVADPTINPNNTAIGDQTIPTKWPTSGGRWIANLTFNGTPGAASIAVEGTHSVFAKTIAGKDPKFVAASLDPAAADFTLLEGSPAIGSGDRAHESPLDFAGRVRSTDVAPDVGAYMR
jgi:hypothetical protein